MPRYHKISEKEWPSLLSDPASQLAIDLSGNPFRLQPVRSWDTGVKRLDQHLLYMFVSGSSQAVLDGQRWVLSAGQFCWVNPDVPFRLGARPSGELPILYRFRFSLERRGFHYRLPWNYRIGNESLEMIEWARALVAEAERPGSYSVHRLKSLVTLLSIHTFEQGEISRSNVPSKLSRRLTDKLTRMVMEHPERRFTPLELARECGLSHDYFSRLFRNTFELAPKQWLVKQRLRIAAGLLAESDSRISEVSQRLGYDDLYLFSRQFRREFGMTASAWRRIHGTGNHL